jgi:hypothetical protein
MLGSPSAAAGFAVLQRQFAGGLFERHPQPVGDLRRFVAQIVGHHVREFAGIRFNHQIVHIHPVQKIEYSLRRNRQADRKFEHAFQTQTRYHRVLNLREQPLIEHTQPAEIGLPYLQFS